MSFTFLGVEPGDKSKLSAGLAGDYTETRYYQSDDIGDTTESLRSSGLLPAPYVDANAENPRLICQPIEVEQSDDDPFLYKAVITWSSEPPTQKEKEEQEDDPLNRRARISVKTVREKEVTHIDKLGKLKINTAGDLFDPPIESNTSYLQITIKKNVTFFPDWAFEFIDCVNEVDFTIRGRTILAGRACIEDIELGEEKFDADVVYCEATVLISVKRPRAPRPSETEEDVPGPWQTEQLNEGLHQLTGGTRVRIQVDDESTPPQKENAAAPVLLAESGAVLSVTNPTDAINNAHYIFFDDHEYKDFNDIAFLWENN